MIVGDIVKELLCVECAAEEQSEIPVGRLYDVCNLVDCLASIESILVCERVLSMVCDRDTFPKSLSHA